MAETFRYHDSKWSEDRDAEYEAAQRRHDLYGWPAKHPGACIDCGRPLSAHKEPGDCGRFLAEGYARDLGWDTSQRGHIKANPYHHGDPSEASLWKIYEDGYRKGIAFRLDESAGMSADPSGGKTVPWVQAIIKKVDEETARRNINAKTHADG